MPLLCKGPRSGPFAQQRTTTALACFYSATLAWNATAVDTGEIWTNGQREALVAGIAGLAFSALALMTR